MQKNQNLYLVALIVWFVVFFAAFEGTYWLADTGYIIQHWVIRLVVAGWFMMGGAFVFISNLRPDDESDDASAPEDDAPETEDEIADEIEDNMEDDMEYEPEDDMDYEIEDAME